MEVCSPRRLHARSPQLAKELAEIARKAKAAKKAGKKPASIAASTALAESSADGHDSRTAVENTSVAVVDGRPKGKQPETT